MTDLCVSFEESLHELILGNVSGPYGLIPPGRCDVVWEAYQREGWIGKLQDAQSEIERDLGMPLCSRELCDEIYTADDQIYLRGRPVAYLGRKVWSEWTEAALTMVLAGGLIVEGYLELTDAELGGAAVEDLQFTYPGEILDIYGGNQTLQAPRVNAIAGGYRFTWPARQLVEPLTDSVMSNADNLEDYLINRVLWRAGSIDSSSAVVAISPCSCGRCSNTPPAYTATLCDAQSGLVCLERTGGCSGYKGQVRISYATGSWCDRDGLDAALKGAVVLLALHKARHTPAKPCGCDNSFIDEMLEIEGMAATDKSINMRYGLTRAAMQVARTIMKYKERPRINAPVASAGILAARPVRSLRQP